MIINTPFSLTAAVLLLSCAIAAIGLRLRQPLIIAFLFSGILIGPSFLNLVHNIETIDLFANIGIAMLLFIVGLRLDVKMIKTVGPVALATGIGQVVFTSAIGFFLTLALGANFLSALYISVALTFSSTIIIVKLLSDKKEIDSLHGRIALGFLIVQDIAAIIALIFLTALRGATGETSLVFSLINTSIKGLFFVVFLAGLAKWVLPPLLEYLARSIELLSLFAITWAVVLALLAETLGFSKEVGAFLAGVSLASSNQRDAIGSRLVILRDFLLLFFFINLGIHLDISGLGNNTLKAIILSSFVLIGNPLIVMIIMGAMNYRKHTSFMCGLTVAQISEFSLILGTMGVRLGHLSDSEMNLITLVGIITILISTYMILYSSSLYRKLEPFLSVFEKKMPAEKHFPDTENNYNDLYLIAGFGRYGTEIAKNLRKFGKHVLAIDFDPEAAARAKQLGIPIIFGDGSVPDMIEQLPLSKIRWVVCTIRNNEVIASIINHLRQAGYNGLIACTAQSASDEQFLRSLKVNEIFLPFADAAEQAAESITGPSHLFQNISEWPVEIKEISLHPGSIFTGKKLNEIPLRRELGVSVAAISRAGFTYINPSPDFQLMPRDRLALIGNPASVDQALAFLDAKQFPGETDNTASPVMEEINVSMHPDWTGKTIVELNLRAVYDIMIISMRRKNIWTTPPHPDEKLLPDDSLLVFGRAESIEKIRNTTS